MHKYNLRLPENHMLTTKHLIKKAFINLIP